VAVALHRTAHWGTAYWLALAVGSMVAVALSGVVEMLALALVAATITCAIFFPKARAPMLLLCVMFFPRAIEQNPDWSWVLSFREPSKDVKFPAQITLCDLAIVVCALSVIWPKLLHGKPILTYGNGWGWAYASVFFTSCVLAGGTYGMPYDAEFIAITNLLRGLFIWIVFMNAPQEEGSPWQMAVALGGLGVVACSTALMRYQSASQMSATEQWEARGEAFNMNANSFSALMLMLGLMGLSLFCLSKSKNQRLTGLGLFALCAVGIAISFSRASMGIFALAATVLMLGYNRRLLFVWLGVIGLAVTYVLTTPDVNGRIELLQGGMEATSDAARPLLYQQSLDMIGDHWELGVGPCRYFDAAAPYRFSQMTYLSHSHSLPLQVLVDTGVFGALFALLVFLAWARRGLTNLRKGLTDHPLRVGAALAIGAALLAQLSDSLLIDVRFFACFAAVMSLFLNAPVVAHAVTELAPQPKRKSLDRAAA